MSGSKSLEIESNVIFGPTVSTIKPGKVTGSLALPAASVAAAVRLS